MELATWGLMLGASTVLVILTIKHQLWWAVALNLLNASVAAGFIYHALQ